MGTKSTSRERRFLETERGHVEKETHLLEINLISAQGLKTPSANLRRLQTYAIAWVDPSAKLRTRVDRLGGENPTWNEKFLFRVTSDFLSCETSGVTVEIYAVGYIKDPLVGTVRFLLSSCISAGIGTPAFTPVQIRRPSGRFHGVLNIAATVLNSLELTAMTNSSAICFRDLGRKSRRKHLHSLRGSDKGEKSSGGESCDISYGESADFSDGADSTASSSSTTSAVLKERNGDRTEMAGNKDSKLDGGGLLCGWMPQRKIHMSQSDQNLKEN